MATANTGAAIRHIKKDHKVEYKGKGGGKHCRLAIAYPFPYSGRGSTVNTSFRLLQQNSSSSLT
jgi:hypothetical protein